ncbi:MAG: MarR family transcriptional regulator [Actinomycetota bacterium]|nr:MarR family transcriptional regulator [Actinomycetota bacterium]
MLSRPEPNLTASYLIGRIDKILRTRIEDAFEESGLSLQEYTTLFVLMNRPGLSNARLARRALVTPQAMHKVIRSLENSGLIERAPSPNGGRVLETTITPAGAELVEGLLERIAGVEDQVLGALDTDERRELIRLLALATSTSAP